MINPFQYDGHMCQIVETDHDGYVMYDGFVDDEQICRNQPTEAEARHAVFCCVYSKSQNEHYTATGTLTEQSGNSIIATQLWSNMVPNTHTPPGGYLSYHGRN